jgi:hypothetical protein
VTTRAWGFGWGAGIGVVLALIALLLVEPPELSGVSSRATLGSWIVLNLGHSVWLFGVVLTLYLMNLVRLRAILDADPPLSEVVELDQLLDVWINLFVGIGVIWTAVGMRSSLQAALGDPGEALVDSADSVLQKLVDGGILLALTTTIIGGMGGYLMRLGKTLGTGAGLNQFYERHHREDMKALLVTARNIETQLSNLRVEHDS